MRITVDEKSKLIKLQRRKPTNIIGPQCQTSTLLHRRGLQGRMTSRGLGLQWHPVSQARRHAALNFAAGLWLPDSPFRDLNSYDAIWTFARLMLHMTAKRRNSVYMLRTCRWNSRKKLDTIVIGRRTRCAPRRTLDSQDEGLLRQNAHKRWIAR